MKNHKMAITLSHDNFSRLEELREHEYCPRSKSSEIAWLISQEWERFQEEKREKTPAELLIDQKITVLRYEKILASRSAKKAADYIEPCHDARIIQFPVRRFLGSVS
jgi:hypothetical protein